MATSPFIGLRVRFAPNPRWATRTVEARVKRHRTDPRHRCPKIRGEGWLDTIDDAGVERSVRPSRCEIL